MARRRKRPPLAPGDPRRKGIANLKPIKPGEVRNPKGKNGSEWLSSFRDFFGEIATEKLAKGIGAEPGDTRYKVALRALFRNLMMGSDQAIKLTIEQLAGRARQSVEVTGADGGPLDVKAEGGAGVVDLLRRIAGVKEE